MRSPRCGARRSAVDTFEPIAPMRVESACADATACVRQRRNAGRRPAIAVSVWRYAIDAACRE